MGVKMMGKSAAKRIASEHRHKTQAHRGFVLTLDAVFAMLILFVSIAFIFNSLKEVGDESIKLEQLSAYEKDALTVMEKTGAISDSTTNTSRVREIIEASPPNICLEVTLQRQNGSILYTMPKQDCTNQRDEIRYERRTVVKKTGSGFDFYSAQVVGWYK